MGLIDDVNIYSGNGLVLSGNRLLPEPMQTQIYIDQNELIQTFSFKELYLDCLMYNSGHFVWGQMLQSWG